MNVSSGSNRAWSEGIENTWQGVPEVEPDWVVAQRERVKVLDVRQPEELEGPLGGVAYAQNVPMTDLGKILPELDPSAPLAILCRSGNRSAHAAIALQRAGFTQVASVRGGMLLWRERQLPDS